MNHAKNLAGLMLSAIMLAGCAGYGGGSTESANNYNQAMNEAKIALKAAHDANNVWRDSAKILEKAEEAAKAGDFEKATRLAIKAKHQGELAVIQAEKQKNAGPI